MDPITIGLALLVLGCVALLSGCEKRTKEGDGDEESDSNIVHGTIKPIEPEEDDDNSEIEVSTGSDASSDAEAEFEEEQHEEFYGDLTNEEKMFIALCMGESGHESYKDQQLVAHVVMNRVGAGKWGGTTVTDVITAKGQFIAYYSIKYDGTSPQYNLAMESLNNRDINDPDPNLEMIINNMMAIYNGEVSDPYGGIHSFHGSNSGDDWSNKYEKVEVDTDAEHTYYKDKLNP